ncbi:MAG TPA: trimeric intracellular cation channel family protein [Longimicrobiales bacterium]|nr:trimeric intracellular cation channel family protein [Longimicrobiales bacterium]
MLQIFDFIGVGVFAVSGALAGGRKSLDLLGIIVVAMVTGIGGGTIRDVLLNRGVFWMAQPAYLWVILASALLTIAYTRRFRPPERALAIADALGLALFSISGAQIAEQLGLPGIVAVIMGAITGVAGGMIRDILTAQIPMILRKGQIYATASIAGITVYLLLQGVMGTDVAAVLGMMVVASLRIAAIVWNLALPVFRIDPENP